MRIHRRLDPVWVEDCLLPVMQPLIEHMMRLGLRAFVYVGLRVYIRMDVYVCLLSTMCVCVWLKLCLK